MMTPHTAFTNELSCHFCTLSKQIIHVVRQVFYLLNLEVGSKIVVIRENLNKRIFQNRPFTKIFHREYYPAYDILYTCTHVVGKLHSKLV